MAAHVPGTEATETTAQTCTICGCEIVPALGGKPTEFPFDETKTPTETPNDNLQKSQFPSWLITVLVAALVAVVEGAVFIVILKKKEHNQ